MPLRSNSFILLLAVPLVFAGHTAFATGYSFSSAGSFSSCSGCSANTSGAEIGWGGTNSINGTGHSAYNGSTMTADALTGQTGTTPATADTIGELTWDNASTSAESTPSTVTAVYKLLLTFSQPSPGGAISDVLDLNITNTPNGNILCFFGGDECNDLTDFSGGSNSLSVDGLVLSNISFIASGGSTFNSHTGVWSNPEGDVSNLFITANITAPAAAPAPVPEPGSVAILGTALVGLGVLRARKRATTVPA